MRRIAELWRVHPVMLTAFLLAAAATLFFLVRTVFFTIYWSDPAHRDQRLEPWMTIRYVSQSWQLPREVMIDALEFQQGAGRVITMRDLAAMRGETLGELEARIRAAAEAHRLENP